MDYSRNLHFALHLLYTVCPEKGTKMFFVTPPTKRGEIWWIVSWINLLQSIWLFSHVTWIVSTLPCETYKAHRARATIELLRQEITEFIPPQLRSSNSRDLNAVDYSVREYYKRRCTKHASLTWSYRRRHWRMAATMTIQLGPLRSQSLFQFVQISDACFSGHIVCRYRPVQDAKIISAVGNILCHPIPYPLVLFALPIFLHSSHTFAIFLTFTPIVPFPPHSLLFFARLLLI